VMSLPAAGAFVALHMLSRDVDVWSTRCRCVPYCVCVCRAHCGWWSFTFGCSRSTAIANFVYVGVGPGICAPDQLAARGRAGATPAGPQSVVSSVTGTPEVRAGEGTPLSQTQCTGPKQPCEAARVCNVPAPAPCACGRCLLAQSVLVASPPKEGATSPSSESPPRLDSVPAGEEEAAAPVRAHVGMLAHGFGCPRRVIAPACALWGGD
jgi:hypothetical protein